MCCYLRSCELSQPLQFLFVVCIAVGREVRRRAVQNEQPNAAQSYKNPGQRGFAHFELGHANAAALRPLAARLLPMQVFGRQPVCVEAVPTRTRMQ